MLRFHETENMRQEVERVIDNFEYYPPGTKNIIPYETSLQDIFNVCVSNVVSKYGLKNNIAFTLRENAMGHSYYSAVVFGETEYSRYKDFYGFIKSPAGERYTVASRPFYGHLQRAVSLDIYSLDTEEVTSVIAHLNKSQIEHKLRKVRERSF